MDFMLLLASIFASIIFSAILIAIVNINIKKFLKTKNIDVDSVRAKAYGNSDVDTHQVGLLIIIEKDGKDKKDYDKYIGRVYLIFIIIFTILFYYILPKIN